MGIEFSEFADIRECDSFDFRASAWKQRRLAELGCSLNQFTAVASSITSPLLDFCASARPSSPRRR